MNSLGKPLNPCQCLWIPDWCPALINEWEGRHWGIKAKLKKSDREIVGFYFSESGMRKASGPRRLSIKLILAKGKRLPDSDAPLKSARDSLKQCGAILDDTPALCYQGPVEYARALLDCQPGTMMLLEDL
jgi:hypothetical protein